MSSKKTLGLLIAISFLLLATAPLMAQVREVTSIAGITRTTGDLQKIQAPPSVEQGQLESDAEAFIFIEREDVALERNLTVDFRGTGTINRSGQLGTERISSGTRINSYFIHFDAVGQTQQSENVQGSVTFENEILGLMLLTNTINSANRFADPELRAVRTEYGNSHGLEFSAQQQLSDDNLTISDSGRTLTFDLQNNVQTDQIRVITRGESDTGGDNGGTDDNRTPNARNDSVSTDENESVTFDVIDNDTDPQNNLDRSSLRITRSPTDGTATVDTDTDDNKTGEITYDPDRNFTGTDTLTYEICDTTDRCDTATLTVTVRERGDGGGGGGPGRLTFRTLLPEADDCSETDGVDIDIVPGNRENPIRLDDAEGYTAVAILSTKDFPTPNCIDVSTVTFGQTGDEQAAISCGVVNVNYDPWKDIVCDFKTSQLGFELEDTEGRLEAETIENDNLDFEDDVQVIDARRFQPRIPRPIPGSASEELAVRSLQLSSSVYFTSAGLNISEMSIQVFNMRGQAVYDSGFNSGNQLRWNLKSSHGQTLANGVYLTLVSVKTADGELHQKLTKVLVLR